MSEPVCQCRVLLKQTARMSVEKSSETKPRRSGIRTKQCPKHPGAVYFGRFVLLVEIFDISGNIDSQRGQVIDGSSVIQI